MYHIFICLLIFLGVDFVVFLWGQQVSVGWCGEGGVVVMIGRQI